MSAAKRIDNTRQEAKIIGRLLGLVRGRASGHGDVDIADVEVSSTTVVYRRGDKTFHLVVHDMTEPHS